MVAALHEFSVTLTCSWTQF